ncbi:MAG: FHA domain-containing protein [Alphaproteobacteria bacterium]
MSRQKTAPIQASPAAPGAARAGGLWWAILGRAILASVAGLAAVASFAGAAVAESAWQRSGGLSIRARQPKPLILQIDHHQPPPSKVTAIAGSLVAIGLPSPKRSTYPAAGQVSAIFFLIDTSDPRRRRDVAAAVGHIKTMLAKAKPHHRFALATFDQELKVLVPLGADADAIAAALGKIKAVGLRTFFFEAGIEAARRLGNFKADRRALYIFSDGKIEDVKTAYDTSSLVTAAEKAGVRIYGFGYTRLAVEPREFQNLRGPAKRSGGFFVKTDRAFRLPKAFLAAPFAAPDGGGRAVFDLTAARRARFSGGHKLRVSYTIDGGRAVTFIVPITLPKLPISGQVRRLFDKKNRPWTIAAILALLAVLAIAIWLVREMQKRRRTVGASTVRLPAIAYLDFIGKNAGRSEMCHPALRIGRNEGNDVTLADNSISSFHAEIHRKRDGSFIITDLDSKNGVFLNDEVVEMAELKDGDEVELGDVRFRFSLSRANR